MLSNMLNDLAEAMRALDGKKGSMHSVQAARKLAQWLARLQLNEFAEQWTFRNHPAMLQLWL